MYFTGTQKSYLDCNYALPKSNVYLQLKIYMTLLIADEVSE